MIITDKIRNMSDPEKMKYFLNKLITLDPHTRAAKEVITIISDLAKGVPIDQFLTKFELLVMKKMKMQILAMHSL